MPREVLKSGFTPAAYSAAALSAQELFLRAIREDFGFFVMVLFHVVRPEVELEREWYVKAICHALSGRLHTPGSRLIINLPPRALKSTLVSVLFAASAQYLQEPLATGGAVFRLDWIGSYPAPPCREDCIAIVQSWDVAVKPGEASDYSVCTTWAITRGNVYCLLDVKRVRLPYYQVLALARQLIAEYRPAHVLVEEAANGAALAKELARSNQHTTIPIRPRPDKLSRAQAATPAFESGRVLLPATAEWRHSYIHELTGFPGTRHDDQVDSTSQFVNWAEERFRPYGFNPELIVLENMDPWLT